MLNITVIPASGSTLTFSTFQNLEIPAPPSGADAEINGDLILKFEDEQEALTYAGQLEELSIELDDKSSPQNIAIGDIIIAIRNDEFVQTYNQ
jgi:hypothetical protein